MPILEASINLRAFWKRFSTYANVRHGCHLRFVAFVVVIISNC